MMQSTGTAGRRVCRLCCSRTPRCAGRTAHGTPKYQRNLFGSLPVEPMRWGMQLFTKGRVAADVTRPGLSKVLPAVVLCLLLAVLPARGQATQPLVAIHDFGLTRALATLPASGCTPSGPGTTRQPLWANQLH